MKKVIKEVTTAYTASFYDYYQSKLPMSRWIAFKTFIRGYYYIKWGVPKVISDKRYFIEGNKI